MFSPEAKRQIAEKIQQILRETRDSELPAGEINFLLHVDGAEHWSWANIDNNNAPIRSDSPPIALIKNTSVKYE